MTDRLDADIPRTATALAGHWKLPQLRAVTLRPRSDGVLRAAQGRLWVTRLGPHGVAPWDSGDEVLETGEFLRVRAGESVVVEPWARDAAAQFDWEPVAAGAIARRPRLVRASVMQPLADLRLALALGAQAVGALGRGLAQLAWELGRAVLPARRTRELTG